MVRIRTRIIIASTLCATLVGCGGGASPATYQSGSGANPLDGAVVRDGGSDIVLTLNDSGTALEQVALGDGTNARTVEFGPPVNNVAVPREITTGGGNSTLMIDRDTQSVDIRTTVPIVGEINISAGIPSELVVTREIFLPEARDPSGVGDCATVVESVDAFCALFLRREDEARAEIIAFTRQQTQQQLGVGLANNIVAGFINSFYDTIVDFCDSWTEVRQGTDDTAPVDPCAG